jgi:quercetin dioxygenase-like cupin family protein
MQTQNAVQQATSANALASTPISSTELDLESEIAQLHCSPEWSTGIARKVLIQYPDLQITLRTMRAHTRIPEHHNPGRICVQTVRGRIRMHADGQVFDLPKGKMLVLDRAIVHDVEAFEESAFMLTVAYPQGISH